MSNYSVPRIAVVNYSTLTPAAAVRQFVPALQTQVRRDFAPIWGIDAVVVSVTQSGILPFHWVLGVFDSADQAGALGYHELTPAGKPVMKVFVKDSADAGVPLSSVASHELLEALGDAFVESLALKDTGKATGILYPVEVCDPVETDLYPIYGVQVSNFVTPYWFGDPLPVGGKYDFLGKLNAPFTMTPGGYVSTRAITKAGLQPWQEAFADARGKQLSKLFQ